MWIEVMFGILAAWTLRAIWRAFAPARKAGIDAAREAWHNSAPAPKPPPDPNIRHLY